MKPQQTLNPKLAAAPGAPGSRIFARPASLPCIDPVQQKAAFEAARRRQPVAPGSGTVAERKVRAAEAALQDAAPGLQRGGARAQADCADAARAAVCALLQALLLAVVLPLQRRGGCCHLRQQPCNAPGGMLRRRRRSAQARVLDRGGGEAEARAGRGQRAGLVAAGAGAREAVLGQQGAPAGAAAVRGGGGGFRV